MLLAFSNTTNTDYSFFFFSVIGAIRRKRTEDCSALKDKEE